MDKVILFKSSENSEEYKSVFASNGYIPLFIPVLDFVFTNLDLLYSKLQNYNDFGGLVITSPRAVDALIKCTQFDNRSVLQKWESKPIFVVGEMTNKRVSSELKLCGCGFRSGNGNALADYIINNNLTQRIEKPLLFPCGNLRSEVLPGKLSKENILLETLVVYNTQMHEDLKNTICDLNKMEIMPSNLIFFSPSGVSFTVPLLKAIHYDFKVSKLVCIGPSTEKKLVECGLTPFATAQEPSPSSIFNAMNNP